MRKIFLFMMVTLDGYFEGPNHDISWHNVDGEFGKFAIEQLDEVDLFLYGRRTYQLMADFWPTEGLKEDYETAIRMNRTPKIVFSKSLKKVEETENWQNVTLQNEVKAAEIQKLKKRSGKDIGIMASSNLCLTLIKMGLIDEFRIMVNPVVISKGTALFEGLQQKLNLKLIRSRQFKNGNILLTYQPLT